MIRSGVIINNHSLHCSISILTYINYYVTRNKLITAVIIAVQPVYILFSSGTYQGDRYRQYYCNVE